MKTKILGCLALLLGTALGQPSLAADAHHHHEHAPASAQRLQLNAGQKWETDATLRRAMAEINGAMSKALPAIHRHRFGNSDYDTLAGQIDQQVAHAVEHCKLAPEADAMLHLVLAELMGGTDLMRGKAAGSRHDGAVRVLRALQSYGKYFQHPNWKVAKA